ncbi:nuclear transport factor 2 family protein [Eubacteriales bacterium OttesenSCG-928-M02]|nr:nuclear transport factor 2 family protein [Eubacteriales bacterium OttesenSCG-928-M02]
MYDHIVGLVDRETAAWNQKDVALLLSIFHPHMVWVWPQSPNGHDPTSWACPQGKFQATRWAEIYEKLFEKYALVHNYRETIQVVCTQEQDGGFAVVDIDTLWRDMDTGEEMHWYGRTCKTYVKTADGVKLIAQTGPLCYDMFAGASYHNGMDESACAGGGMREKPSAPLR